MKAYPAQKIRNIVLLGHGSSGKTSLVESLLFQQGVTKRLGSVDDGTTIADYDKEEIARKYSINTSIIPIEYKDHKYNFLDAPGYFDFYGEIGAALRVAGGAVIVIDASSGIEVGTEKAWEMTEELGTPKMIFLNKMDKENIDYIKLIEELKEKFGKKIAPFEIPMYEKGEFVGYVNVVDKSARVFDGYSMKDVEMPKEYEAEIAPLYDMLVESVAETDEVLMEKFFAGESFTVDEVKMGLRKGVIAGETVPVIMGSALKSRGTSGILKLAAAYLPTPVDKSPVVKGISPKDDSEVELKIDENEAFSALAFKTIVDQFVGKITLLKVYSGRLKKDMEVYNSKKDKTEKILNTFFLRGKEQIPTDYAGPGDIVAVSKLQVTTSGDTLCEKSKPIILEGIKYPEPCLFMAVEPKDKKDEDKIGPALQKLTEEDPSFVVTRNTETHQMLIGGIGSIQLQVITSKLKNLYGVTVDLVDQKIAYRETIKGSSDVQGKHKKQTGGSGQYGDVHIRFSPSKEDFEFSEEIFGGSVPKQYIPAVEKGLRECLNKGVLAGYPVVGIKAVLYDGSYHDVDSNENAFKMAASLAFKKGLQEAKPVLLEPIMRVEILIPDDYMGDIMGDMNKRRGRILGMDQAGGGKQKVHAEAPQAELFTYASDLRSMTQARGSFTIAFDRYEELPKEAADKIIAAAKVED